jgi:hypothetical protein
MLHWSRRTSWTIRAAALLLISVGPIVATAWQQAPGRVLPLDLELDHSAPVVQQYLERRPAILDHLLPGGEGGTRYFSSLKDKAGTIHSSSATVVLAVNVQSRTIDSVELHERAHLLGAALPDEVARLVAALPAPHPDTYAATNPVEHFVEMAATAWDLIRPIDGLYCMEPADVLLPEAETRVPGTAGFLLWFLDQVEHEESLRTLAATLAAPTYDAWVAIRDAVEARRGEDGRLMPWPRRSIADELADVRRHARSSGHWSDPVYSALLWPSERLARLVQ